MQCDQQRWEAVLYGIKIEIPFLLGKVIWNFILSFLSFLSLSCYRGWNHLRRKETEICCHLPVTWKSFLVPNSEITLCNRSGYIPLDGENNLLSSAAVLAFIKNTLRTLKRAEYRVNYLGRVSRSCGCNTEKHYTPSFTVGTRSFQWA